MVGSLSYGKHSLLCPTCRCPSCRYWQCSYTLSCFGMGKYTIVVWRNCLWGAPLHLQNQEKSLPWKTQFLISSYWAKNLGTDGKKCEALCDEMSWETVKAWYLSVLLGKETSLVVSKPETQDGSNKQFTRLWTLWEIQVIFCGGGRSLKDPEKV